MSHSPSNNDKRVLEQRLADLIGFEELSDLFEHALSFNSPQDLLEYMGSLLGQSGENVRLFCSDLQRFKKGEPISKPNLQKENPEPRRAPLDYSGILSSGKKDKKTRNVRNKTSVNAYANTGNEKSGKSGKLSKREQLQRKNAAKKKTTVLNSKNMTKVTNQMSSMNIHNPSNSSTVSTTTTSTAKTQITINTPHSKPSQIKEESIPPITPIARGTANVNCGCFGTIYEPLINCLNCGRIICKKEGYGFCPSCGYEVAPPNSQQRSVSSKSQRHKDRLLKFDREFTERTKIYDDQADYFTNSSSVWLTQDQQEEAKEMEKERRTKLHERKKQVLTIDFGESSQS